MAFSSLWVKVSTQLPRHPKTITAAASLGISAAELVGRLVMLWIYCAEFRPSGILASSKELANAMDWGGDAETLAAALEKIPCFHGFIERDAENGLEIHVHDWDIFNSSAASSEEKRREKKRKEEGARGARDHETMTENGKLPREIPAETKAALEKLFNRGK